MEQGVEPGWVGPQLAGGGGALCWPQAVPGQGTWGFGLDGGGLEGTSGSKKETWVWWGMPRAWRGLVLLWESSGPSTMVKKAQAPSLPGLTWSGEPPGQRERREPAPAPPWLPTPTRGLQSALHRYRVEEQDGGASAAPPGGRGGVFGLGLRGLTGRSRHTGRWRRTCSRGHRAQHQGPGRAPCGRCSTRPGRGAALSAAPRL